MENFYEELYQYLIERGIDDDEATEVINYLYEDNIHEYGLITENKSRAFLNLFKAVGYMSGVLKRPGAKKAVKQVVQKIQGTPVQGKLLTKTGKAQDFTKGKMPFTGTDPVPAASSKLPQPKGTPIETPGQLKLKLFPAPKTKSVPSLLPDKLQPKAPKPEFGPNAVKSTPYKTSKPELRPGGQTPKPEFKVTQPKPNAGGATVIPRTNANTRIVQPPAPKPQFGTQVSQVAGTVSRGRQLMKNLRRLTLGGLATYGVAKGLEALDKKPTSGLTPEQQKSRTDAANQARKSGKMANIPPAEGMVNNPDYGKKPVQRPAKELSAAAKDFDRAFAAALEKGEKTFPWRGKMYNTKLK